MSRDLVIHEITNYIQQIRLSHPLRVAIDGVDASGKTTLADELASQLNQIGHDVIRASVDGFHNPQSIRYRRGHESPEGYFLDSFDYPTLIKFLLEPLGPGGNKRYKTAVFDYQKDSPIEVPTLNAQDDSILLFDGVFLLRPDLRDYWDLTIFVEASFDIILDRAIKRLGGASEVYQLGERYRKRYIPGQRIYLHTCAPYQRADLIVENDDLENPTLKIKKNRVN